MGNVTTRLPSPKDECIVKLENFSYTSVGLILPMWFHVCTVVSPGSLSLNGRKRELFLRFITKPMVQGNTGKDQGMTSSLLQTL